MKETKTKNYIKPLIKKEDTYNFPREIIDAAKNKIICRQCSGCHGCR